MTGWSFYKLWFCFFNILPIVCQRYPNDFHLKQYYAYERNFSKEDYITSIGKSKEDRYCKFFPVFFLVVNLILYFSLCFLFETNL